MNRRKITFKILHIPEDRFYQNRVIDKQRKPHPNKRIMNLLIILLELTIIKTKKTKNSLNQFKIKKLTIILNLQVNLVLI